MEVDLQSLFGLHVTWCAQLYSLAETPQLPPPPAFGLVLRGRYLSAKKDDIFCKPQLLGVVHLTSHTQPGWENSILMTERTRGSRGLSSSLYNGSLDPSPGFSQFCPRKICSSGMRSFKYKLHTTYVRTSISETLSVHLLLTFTELDYIYVFVLWKEYRIELKV